MPRRKQKEGRRSPGRPPLGPRFENILDVPRVICPNCGCGIYRIYKTERYNRNIIRRLYLCLNPLCNTTTERHEELTPVDLQVEDYLRKSKG